jgi:DNA gyrase subunit A
LITIKLDEGDELRWIQQSTGNDEIVISTSMGQAIRFKESDARPMGRAARGVRGIRLRPGDKVVGMDIAREDKQLLVMSIKGYGKQTKVSNFPTHKRGGVGIKAAVVTAKTGSLVTVQSLENEASEVIMISTKGQTIRVALKDIPTIGRTTQGVRVMRLGDDDTLVSIGLVQEQAVIAGDEDDDEEATDES